VSVTSGAGVDTDRVLTPTEFGWIQRFLRERTGIELKTGKEALVMGRLDRRLRHHGLVSYTEYFRLLGDGGDVDETRMATDLLTTNETYFFREPAHFSFLREWAARRGRAAGSVRIWSAASSTGEEAYSIAMTLADALPAQQHWEIVGTDISTRVLETARRGMYPIAAAPKIPRDLLQQHCLRGRDEFDGFLAIAASLRSQVRFEPANLLDLPVSLGQFDLIFLRNVMIYFELDTKRDLIARVERMIRPGGYLIISHSETLSGIQTGLKLVSPSIYRRADDGE
jgi:chemotaxis protein methyltransferase CheR